MIFIVSSLHWLPLHWRLSAFHLGIVSGHTKGMGVFTGKFQNWNVLFTVLAVIFCAIGRAVNIFPLSLIANLCRRRRHNRIPLKMQFVLWFTGLRGAIAFALSENMPGPNRETYATATLSICLFTTIVCGGFTEQILSKMGMKQGEVDYDDGIDDIDYSEFMPSAPITRRVSTSVYDGAKGAWKHFDDVYLKKLFGGARYVESGVDDNDLGNYEMNIPSGSVSSCEDLDDTELYANGEGLSESSA